MSSVNRFLGGPLVSSSALHRTKESEPSAFHLEMIGGDIAIR